MDKELYIIRLSLCYIHVFTISSWMLKQFIDLKRVFSSSRLSLLLDFFFFSFWVGTCLAVCCQPWWSLLCSVAAKVASLFLPEQDEADDRMEECRRQCRVDFNWRPVGKHETKQREVSLVRSIKHVWSFRARTCLYSMQLLSTEV